MNFITAYYGTTTFDSAKDDPYAIPDDKWIEDIFLWPSPIDFGEIYSYLIYTLRKSLLELKQLHKKLCLSSMSSTKILYDQDNISAKIEGASGELTYCQKSSLISLCKKI